LARPTLSRGKSLLTDAVLAPMPSPEALEAENSRAAHRPLSGRLDEFR